jgi:hypothetical protein
MTLVNLRDGDGDGDGDGGCGGENGTSNNKQAFTDYLRNTYKLQLA